ncbi:MAG TPA: hypothetical protein VFX59_18245 [Polyangiales bacterium]|nr:hypothetical protein [Polyangiales bacterium]
MISAPSLALPLPQRGLAEFLLVGGLTPLLFLLSWLLRESLGLDDAELAVGFTFFYGAHLVNDPHFAVSYLLFYEDVRARAFGAAFSSGQRVRYWLAGFVVPLCLLAWAGYALLTRCLPAFGILIQLMFWLVGWHYVKQGFGVLMVLGAQRGMRFSLRERQAVLAHALCGWLYAWANPHDPGRTLEEKGVLYATFAHPRWLEPLALALLLATVPPLVWALRGKRRLATPLTGFLCSVWAWSIFSALDPLVRYAIPALHSLQYLYFVWLLKGSEAREREREPWFETAAPARLARLALCALALGWLLFHGLPGWLDGGKKGPLGPTPWFAALYAFVNIHHYFMDSVLWRRDNPRMRYLQMSTRELP